MVVVVALRVLCVRACVYARARVVVVVAAAAAVKVETWRQSQACITVFPEHRVRTYYGESLPCTHTPRTPPPSLFIHSHSNHNAKACVGFVRILLKNSGFPSSLPLHTFSE